MRLFEEHGAKPSSPFAETGNALLAAGYSPIPIVPGDKMPGHYGSGVWRAARNWSEFCEHRPTEFQMRLWNGWPNAGVGVALGRDLVGIDIDNDEPAVREAIESVLPPCTVGKVGARGVTYFFRGDTTKIKSRAFKIDGQGIVDVLAHGRQTVLPPSIHPRTGQPYRWLTGMQALEDVALEDLPELPDNICDLIALALEQFGYKAEPAQHHGEFTGEAVCVSTEDNWFRKLNQDALDNLDNWVPALQLPKARRLQGRWVAVADWRPSSTGRPVAQRSPNLSFHKTGIADHGDGNKPYTPLNVVMAALNIGQSDIGTAAKWLGERLGYDFSVRIILKTDAEKAREKAAQKAQEARPAAAAVPVLDLDTLPSSTSPDEPEMAYEPDAEPEPVEEVDPDYFDPRDMAEINDLCQNVPGVVGQFIDYAVSTSTNPSAPLALGLALTLVGTVGGRYHGGPTDLRTNLYVVGLAPSGYGKDHARKCAKRLMMAAGLDRFLGPARIMSDSALREAVARDPAQLMMLDEFGGLIRQMMDRRAPQHHARMRHDMLEFYTTASDYFSGAEYAGKKAERIYNPCLSIYGTTTQADFWPSMSSVGVTDGFLPRWLCINVMGDPPDDVRPTANVRDVPKALVDGFRDIVLSCKAGNLAGIVGEVTPKFAHWGANAEDAYLDFKKWCALQSREASPEVEAMWTRAAAQAVKLAHVVAIGVDPNRPIISEENMEWGIRLALLSTRTFIAEIKDRLASSDKQAEYLDLKRMVREAGVDGISRTALLKRINGRVDTRRAEDILKQLQESGQIVGEIGRATAKGGRPGFRYYIVRKGEAGA